MKKTILTIFTSLLLFTGMAQEVSPCATTEKQNEFFESLTPQQQTDFLQQKEAYEQEIQTYIANHPEAATNSHQRAIQYTIPVVIHIIHAGGPENISNEQVEDAIQIINDDYQKQNSDANDVVSAFQSIVADVEVEFKLAKRDPQGNCTNGITRTFSNVTFGGSGSDRIDAVQAEHGNWPGDEYLNVFVADQIGGAAGYTQLPYDGLFGGGTAMGNGIHILHNYVGSIGTSGTYSSRALTHEIGHWLDLPHPWGGSNTPAVASNCNEDDGVNDTPNTEGWTSCNLSGTTCGSLDNVENYMDYSYCSKMFTLDQKARMHAALNSSTGGRNNVVSSSNLTATGVNLPDQLCKAEFQADKRVICPGATVNFEDLSYDAPSDWNWSFAGGTPSTSVDQNPSITYNTSGTYEVELDASDGTNSDSKTKAAFITVLSQSGALPLEEGFESYSSLPNSTWATENPNGAGFEIETGVAFTGNKCVKLANFGQSGDQVDGLVSVPYDLSTITNDVTLSYRYAYRRRSSSNYETLRVLITNNCGETWTQRNTLAGNNLGTQIAPSSWEPNGQGDWVTVHMTNITTSFWVDNFRFKFEFESDGGNNIYLDNINLYDGTENDDPLGIEENSLVQGLAIFPNPTDGATNVEFSVNTAQSITVSLLNTVGQEIQTNVIQAKSGKNLVLMGTSDVEAGVYFVKVAVAGKNQVRRLVIQ